VAGARQLGQPPWILRRCREQHLVPDTTQAPQPKSVEPDDAFPMRKSHLDLFAFAGSKAENICSQ
jgi:hypothetical protein